MPTGTVEPEPQTCPAPLPARPEPERTRISRTVLNYWLDAGLLVSVIFDVWITTMLRVVFPAPTTAAGWTLWGLSFDDWHTVQFFALGFTALLTIEHLVLHWNWICCVTATQILGSSKRPDEGSQAVYGVGTFITLALIVLAGLVTALLCVRVPV